MLLFYALAAFSLPGAPDDPQRGGIPTAWFLAFAGAGVSLYFLTTHDWDAFPTKYTTLSAFGRALQGPLPELTGHRLNPNVAGGILAMMIPFAGAVNRQAGRAHNWPALILGLTLLGLTLLGLLLSASRGAWLAVLGAMVLAVLWWLVGLGNGKQPGRQRLLFIGMLLLGAMIILSSLILWPEISQRLIGSLSFLAGGTSRLDLFRNSLILVQEYPFIGAGLGTYMMLYSTYAYLTHVGFIIHAHNIYLDVLIEQGFVALLALLWMWGVFAAALWRESFDGRIRPYLGAAALSLSDDFTSRTCRGCSLWQSSRDAAVLAFGVRPTLPPAKRRSGPPAAMAGSGISLGFVGFGSCCVDTAVTICGDLQFGVHSPEPG